MKQSSIRPETLKNYIGYFEDSFLIEEAKRFDVKGKKDISTPSKYYFSDIGLRNARLNFRQDEETHGLENIVYNELIARGFNVDVGVVGYYAKGEHGLSEKRQSEVDFVCNQADFRCYIQVALSILNEEKLLQEENSLSRIPDSFKKAIIAKDVSRSHYNDQGIYFMNLFDFLLNQQSLRY